MTGRPAQLGVSRATVREVLRQLAVEGLVTGSAAGRCRRRIHHAARTALARLHP